jgi:hypothetical protein
MSVFSESYEGWRLNAVDDAWVTARARARARAWASARRRAWRPGECIPDVPRPRDRRPLIPHRGGHTVGPGSKKRTTGGSHDVAWTTSPRPPSAAPPAVAAPGRRKGRCAPGRRRGHRKRTSRISRRRVSLRGIVVAVLAACHIDVCADGHADDGGVRYAEPHTHTHAVARSHAVADGRSGERAGHTCPRVRPGAGTGGQPAAAGPAG